MNVIALCTAAFATVFVVLAFLSASMYAITLIFPERATAVDAPVVAAISSAVASLSPGARVTKIQEES